MTTAASLRPLPDEPGFDLPPPPVAVAERRLSGLALTVWEGCRRGGALPRARDTDGRWPAGSTAFRLDLAVAPDGTPTIVSVGSALADAFALMPGALPARGESPLADALHEAVARMIAQRAPTGFVVAPPRVDDLPTSRTDAIASARAAKAVLFSRALLLPLADPDGRLAAAVAIITWREALAATAQAALDRELDAALAARPEAARDRSPVFTARPPSHRRS